MEEIIQRIFAILMSVLILFLLPLYIAFEKKDDISYALALKITTNFVDTVTDRGYLTKEMYQDFLDEISLTDNVYDVSMEYIKKEYNPVVQIIGKTTSSSGKDVIVSEYDYLEKKIEFEKYDKKPKNEEARSELFDVETKLDPAHKNEAKAIVTYKLSEKKYFTNQIIKYLDNTDQTFIEKNQLNYSYYNNPNLEPNIRIYGSDSEGMLLMNKGDQFNIYIKNKNTTIATVLFNTLTFGANLDNNTKVYINYGGTVKNEEYRTNDINLKETANVSNIVANYDEDEDEREEDKEINNNIVEVEEEYSSQVPTIPNGFKYLSGTVDEKNYTIKNDKDGNEFVWIPVPNVEKLIEDMTIYGIYDDTTTDYYQEIKKSISKYKGFYINRNTIKDNMYTVIADANALYPLTNATNSKDPVSTLRYGIELAAEIQYLVPNATSINHAPVSTCTPLEIIMAKGDRSNRSDKVIFWDIRRRNIL